MEISECVDECSTDAEQMEISSDNSKAPNLPNINDDCKEHIFEYLDWSDLLTLADTNKQLYTAVCQVFKRKYGNAKICLGFPVFRYIICQLFC